MLTSRDPFGEFDQLMQRLGTRTSVGQLSIPMDAYRRDGEVWIHFDLPGVYPEAIEIDVEKNVLTVGASRNWELKESDQMLVNERATGDYVRRIQLSEGLDRDGIEASYDGGVLTLRIPEVEKPQARRIAIATGKRSDEATTDGT